MYAIILITITIILCILTTIIIIIVVIVIDHISGNGRKSTFAFVPGTMVKFDCDAGYVLVMKLIIIDS